MRVGVGRVEEGRVGGGCRPSNTVYGMRELRTLTLSGLPASCYADSASSLVSLQDTVAVSSCIQRVRTFLCERAKKNLLGKEKRRRPGVCVSVSGSGCYVNTAPIEVCAEKPAAVQFDSDLQMRREGRALNSHTQQRPL